MFKYILVLFLLMGCSSVPQSPTLPAEDITLNIGKKVTLWSTYYFTPLFKSGNGNYPIRDRSGKAISGGLSLNHYCFIGLQGTGVVDNVTYTYSRKTSTARVPCERSFLSRLSYAAETGKIKYAVDSKKYGSGNKGNALFPYKSVACDQKVYKFGQKFYIPSAKGTKMPDGSTHDGIFICHDVGGAVKGNHIDTFIGHVKLYNVDFNKRYSIAYRTMPSNMQKYIKSTKTGTFTAYLVD